jgi:hypothetical protein
MTAARARRFGLVLITTLLLLLGAVTPAQAVGRQHRGQVTLTAIGHPIWKPADCHVFSAPIGTADDGYAGFNATEAALLPPPNHVRVPKLGIGPGAPHKPPYTREVAHGLAATGFQQSRVFSQDEFSNGNGVWLVCMFVPQPGIKGSAPDFRRGSVIPNTLFPLHVEGKSLRNGADFDPALTKFDVPKLDGAVDPRFAGLDGHSHIPFFVADSADFGPAGTDLPGRYRYDLTFVDATGRGWKMTARFGLGN